MTVIGTNIAALRASNANTSASLSLQQSMERLSTGKRINSASDDAAGLAISNSMTSQIKGMSQGIRNANDGIAMAQTADGALDEVTNMMQRIRELAVQAASGTYSSDDRTNMQTEVTQLSTQINSILSNTKFNGVALFDGTAGTSGTVKIQTGANSADTVSMTFADQTTALDLSSASVAGTDGTAATAALATVDTALKAVNTARAGYGAAQSQLQSAVNNMTTNVANLSDARSRIQDADYSAETTNLAKAQILSQASTAMLAQANQSQQSVLKLLQ
jgi:flagellin